VARRDHTLIWQTSELSYAIRTSLGGAVYPAIREAWLVQRRSHPFDVDTLAQFRLNCRGPKAHPAQVRPVGVLVVHNHRLYADAVARRLNGEPEVRVSGIASTGAAASTAIEVLDPRVAVLDMELKDISSLELTGRWSARVPPVAVAAILGSDDRAMLIRAMRAGASAVTSKHGPMADLVSAVKALALGQCWVPTRLLAGIVSEMRLSRSPPNLFDEKLARLTVRERDILDRIAAGHDRAAIAEALGISVNTVRTHAQNLLGKLGVHSTLEAATVAHRATSRRIAT
jgi:DNA-binding NarL/FixJ family response regulator